MYLGLGLHANSMKILHIASKLFRKYILKQTIKSIFFYPERPNLFDIMYKICVWNGYNILTSSNNSDIKFHWEDTTFPIKITDDRFINSRCRTISKTDISRAFEKIFNYKLNIDPCKFKGKCVKKSNLNAKHDGVIIECPIPEREHGFVYQRLINNTLNNIIIEDIRIPVFKVEIPFVYLKKRLIKKRFMNDNTSVMIKNSSEILSLDERSKIIILCKEMNIDYCEIDAVRDYPEGKLYIVDINHCPSGPPNHSSIYNKVWATKKLAYTFDQQFGNVNK